MATPTTLEPGDRLLLRHLAAVERLTSAERPSARERLEARLGHDSATLLVHALVPAPAPERGR